MTNDEAKAAWRSQTPVMYNGVKYTLRGLIYRYPSKLYLELLDKNGNCIVEVLSEKAEVFNGIKNDAGTSD